MVCHRRRHGSLSLRGRELCSMDGSGVGFFCKPNTGRLKTCSAAHSVCSTKASLLRFHFRNRKLCPTEGLGYWLCAFVLQTWKRELTTCSAKDQMFLNAGIASSSLSPRTPNTFPASGRVSFLSERRSDASSEHLGYVLERALRQPMRGFDGQQANPIA